MQGANEAIRTTAALGPGVCVVIVGRLATGSRRSLAPALERRGLTLATRVSARTDLAVIGGRAFHLLRPEAWRALVSRLPSGCPAISEGGLRRALGLAPAPDGGDGPHGLTEAELCRAGGFDAGLLQALLLFDLLVPVEGRYSFADALLARDVGGLLRRGLPLARLVETLLAGPQTVRRLPSDRLTAGEGGELMLRIGGRAATLGGQFILHLPDERPPAAAGADRLAAGEEAEALGERRAAERLYRAAIDADRRDPVAHADLANLLVGNGRIADARIHYEKAGRLDPGFAEAWYNLALCLIDARRNDGAARALRLTLCAEPSFADALFNLGMLLAATGHKPRACRLLERCLAMGVQEPWAGVARRALRLCREENRAAPALPEGARP